MISPNTSAAGAGHPDDAHEPASTCLLMRKATMKYLLAGLILVVGLSIAAAQAPGNDAENALAVQATAALTARNWQEAERAFKLLTAMEPTRSDYQKSLCLLYTS